MRPSFDWTRVDHALVTGAAGAIGGALAERVARRAPGARLTVVDHDPRVDAIAARLGAVARTWDLRDPAALEPLWRDATAERAVDLLVNCAGVMDLRTLAATPWAEGLDLLNVDLVSPLRLASLATPGMKARRRGALVNVSSMAGLVPLRGAAYYGAAKAGLAMASEVARLELAPHGVRVVTVYPGPVASGLERRARAQVRPSRIANALPTGDPAALADLVIDALDRGRPRVAFPLTYAIAAEVLGVSRRVTERLSPVPWT